MRSRSLLSVCLLAVAASAGYRLARRAPRPRDRVRASAPATRRPFPEGPGAAQLSDRDIRRVTRNYLLYFILPLWVAAGFADWTRHRATRIERTAGAKETLMHLMMLLEAGVPLLAGLFLEITPPVLALMIGAFFVHEATALWDVTYAIKRREVTPAEQHIHSFLEMMPLMAIGFVSVLHWPGMRALAGRGGAPARGFRWKKERLPAAYLASLLGSVVLIEFVPYLEELWRDWRAFPGHLALPPRAADPGRTGPPSPRV